MSEAWSLDADPPESVVNEPIEDQNVLTSATLRHIQNFDNVSQYPVSVSQTFSKLPLFAGLSDKR
jgi:hypothetical protein